MTSKIIRRYISCIAAVILCSVSLSMKASDKPSSHAFAWGAEIGGGIDLTSNDLSSVNIDAYFGYRNSWINMLGVGMEINAMVNNNYSSFPIYAIFQSNFRTTPSIVFMDIRVGYALNNLAMNTSQNSFYTSPGIGFRLASGRKFQSYLTLSYTFNNLRPFNTGTRLIDIHGLHLATIRLGVSF